MSFFAYLADRAMIIIGWLIGAVLIVITLTVSGSNTVVNAVYAFLLAGLIGTVALLVDYYRQRRFYAAARARPSGLSQPVLPAKTREQHLMVRRLAEQEAALSTKLAQERSRYREQRELSSALVHQMKSPLSVIELIANRELQANPHSEAWQSVAEEGRELGAALNQLLTSARLPGFGHDYHAERIELQPFLRGIINEEKRRFIAAGVYPQLHVPAGLTVVSDPKWLRAIVKQLAGNAVKYSPAHENATVHIGANPVGEAVHITVRDHGIGIPAGDIPRVFEQFFTGENGRNSRVSTGIGLTLAARIAAVLEIELRIESPGPGAGTTATVVLPKPNLTAL